MWNSVFGSGREKRFPVRRLVSDAVREPNRRLNGSHQFSSWKSGSHGDKEYDFSLAYPPLSQLPIFFSGGFCNGDFVGDSGDQANGAVRECGGVRVVGDHDDRTPVLVKFIQIAHHLLASF